MQENFQIQMIQMTPASYQEVLEKASALGAMRAMQLCGVAPQEYLTRAELSRKFNRGKVDRLIRDGKLTAHRLDGGLKKYKLTEVLTLID